MDLVFSFADRISVLVNGAMLVEGPPDEVARDPQVKAVYLGEAARCLTCSRIDDLRAGYGEAVVLPDMSLRLPRARCWRCWAATAPARPR